MSDRNWALSIMQQNLTAMLFWGGLSMSAMLGITTVVLSKKITEPKTILIVFFGVMLVFSLIKCNKILGWNKDLRGKVTGNAGEWLADPNHYSGIVKWFPYISLLSVAFFLVTIFFWFFTLKIQFRGWNKC